MSLNGRKIIETPMLIVNGNNIVSVLQNAFNTFVVNQGDINYLFNYYKGIQPILNRTKVYHTEINNKIVENHANEIVSFKVGYLLWKPIQYIARKDKANANGINLLNDFLIDEDKESCDLDIAKNQSICGTAYRLTLPNVKYEKGNGESPFKIYSIHPREAFVIYGQTYEHKPMVGVFADKIMKNGKLVDRWQAYTETRFYEVIDGIITKNKPHTLGRIPLVEYPLNDERIGDFEKVIDLLDAINTVQSNRVDGVEQFIQALMVFKNVDIDDKDFIKLKEMGAIKIKDNGELQANVSYLTQELNQTQVQSLVNSMYAVVKKIVGMPVENDGTQNVDANNGAVALSNGWQGADARASQTEIIFKKSERQFLKLVLTIGKTLTENELDLALSDIDIKFTRRNYENFYQKAQVLDLLLKNSQVSPKNAFEVCGLFTDPEQAYLDGKAHYEEVQKKLAEQNTPEGEDEDAEN